MTESPAFYVYVIEFDYEVYGIFATKEEAEKSLNNQISDHGPAWSDCVVRRCRIDGTPELTGDHGERS